MNRFIILITLLFVSSNFIFAQVDTNLSKKNAVRIFFEEPQFIGGEDKLLAYLGKNTNYPKEANSNGIEGKVEIEFVVCEDGSLCGFINKNNSNNILADEAIRVLKSMPNWKPAKLNGKIVSSYYSVPVVFTLDEGRERKKKRKKSEEEK